MGLVIPALAGDERLCAEAVRAVDAWDGLPTGLLAAVALSESGRRQGSATAAWPWTVNDAGDGRFFATKAEARAWVERLRADGRRNIDVGCMQVNLMHHPAAFASLDEALDPLANVAYGARFLAVLHVETSSWTRAIERYHTASPRLGEAYRARVEANWDDGAADGDTFLRPALGSLDAGRLQGKATTFVPHAGSSFSATSSGGPRVLRPTTSARLGEAASFLVPAGRRVPP